MINKACKGSNKYNSLIIRTNYLTQTIGDKYHSKEIFMPDVEFASINLHDFAFVGGYVRRESFINDVSISKI